jgi:hypothetical protein
LEDRLAPAAHDTLATAIPLKFDSNLQASVFSVLSDPNQVDLYHIQLRSGDEVTAQVRAYTSSNKLDSGLRVFDSSGRQLAFNDNQDGFDPRLIFNAPAAGDYYVGVSSADNFSYDTSTSGQGFGGNSTGSYTLNIARSPYAESEANAGITGLNDTIDTADVINGNAHVHGAIGFNDQDYFRFFVTEAGSLTASGTPADETVLLPRLALYGDSGQLLIQSDALSPSNASARLMQHLQPGTYYLAVSAISNQGSLGNRSYVLDTTLDPTLTPFRPLPEDPYISVVGDFNHDGNLDIATVGFLGGLSIYLGQGDGTFRPAGSYDIGPNPSSMAVGDFNHDGNLDIVVANQHVEGSISVLLGRGDGTFLPAVTYQVWGAYTDSVAVGDFNDDGNLDIVAANLLRDLGGSWLGDFSVLLGRGDGTFLPAVTYSGGERPTSVVVGDFNDDGNPDIVTASADDTGISVSLGRGDGTFLPAVTYSVGFHLLPTSVAVGDFNHDSNLDVVIGNSYDGSVSVLLGRGDGTLLPAVSYSLVAGDFAAGVAVGDFNDDGNLDIVAADSQSVSVLLGRGDGTFLPATEYFTGIGAYSPSVGDFNHDGNLDLVEGNSILLGRGDGTFQSANAFNLGISAFSLAAGDFNHDGNLDIVTLNEGTVSVLLGRGDGTFLPAVTYSIDPGADELAVEDFNHDGNPDIVTSNADLTFGPTSVLLGRGDGTFLPASILPIDLLPDTIPSNVVEGDFNNDGIVDQAAVDEDSSRNNPLSISLGEGNGQFRQSTPDNGIAINHIPYFGDLEPGPDTPPDSLILNGIGELLFRRGLQGDPDHFAPPVVINEERRARDFTVFNTGAGPAIAAIDTKGNTVSIYTWSGADSNHPFDLSTTLSTGNLPVRIAAADLNGDGLDDLVVGNDFDHSVTVYFQTPSGNFNAALTREIGAGPSAITFADLGGRNGPDIVISDQVSGDVSVLLNDPTHLFSLQSRYRAASGLFDIDTSQGEQTVVSRHQTIGVVADDFIGSGLIDLVVVNRGDDNFTLLPNQGQGRFTDPQPGNSYFTSGRPSQVVSFRFPNDRLPSVAILMEDRNQIWIYRNNGDGTFAPPAIVDAGKDARGFSVASVEGKLALLVGNEYGDILTLLYDGQGVFAPDRANLTNTALAVGVDSSGRQFAVVADQKLDQASVYFRKPGTDQFDSPIPINGETQPVGAVQLFSVPGDPNPYLVVANSLSNSVLVFHSSGDGQFDSPVDFTVGLNPGSVTVADLNGDGIPDLLVANQGSNDVSVLIGSIDPDTNQWTATPYQRLKSGGSGPISVAVINSNSFHGPDLLVTNSDGKVTLLPGIGSGRKGSGFFLDNSQPTFDQGGAIVHSVFDARTGRLFVLGLDGSINVLNGNGLTPIFGGGVSALGDFNGVLVAGLEDGSIALLSPAGELLARAETGFADQISALDVLQNGRDLDVFVTQTGHDMPVIVSFHDVPVIPIATPPTVLQDIPVVLQPPTGEGTSLPDLPLVLIATLLPGGLAEPHLATTTATAPIEEGFGLVFPPALPQVRVLSGGIEEVLEAVVEGASGKKWDLAGWESYSLGATEALYQRLQHHQIRANLEDILEVLTNVLHQLRGLVNPTALPKATKAELLLEATPLKSEVFDDDPDLVPDLSERLIALGALSEPDGHGSGTVDQVLAPVPESAPLDPMVGVTFCLLAARFWATENRRCRWTA